MKDRTPAEVFPPGDFLKEELEAREWTQTDLASILGRPNRLVSEIVNGRRGITPETALGLADAFGTSAEYWMNLETAYQLSKARTPNDAVSHRAKIYGKAPVKDMIKRGWLEGSSNTSVFERNLLDFFEIESLEQEPKFYAHAARKAAPYTAISPVQLAWLFRVKHLAKTISAEQYNPENFNDLRRDSQDSLQRSRRSATRTPGACGNWHSLSYCRSNAGQQNRRGMLLARPKLASDSYIHET